MSPLPSGVAVLFVRLPESYPPPSREAGGVVIHRCQRHPFRDGPTPNRKDPYYYKIIYRVTGILIINHRLLQLLSFRQTHGVLLLDTNKCDVNSNVYDEMLANTYAAHLFSSASFYNLSEAWKLSATRGPVPPARMIRPSGLMFWNLVNGAWMRLAALL